MLIELFIASQVSKAADSLRRIDESSEYYEDDNGINGFDRFLAFLEKKNADKKRIEEQLQGLKRTDDGEEEILD